MWASALLIGASPALVLQRPAVPLLREARLPRRTTMLSEQPAWLSRGQGADLLRRDQELGLLALIEGTDRGVQATDEARRTIAALIGGSGVALLRLGHRRGAAQSFGRRLRDGDGTLGGLPPPRSKAFLASAASVLDCVEEEDSETTTLYACRAKVARDEL